MTDDTVSTTRAQRHYEWGAWGCLCRNFGGNAIFTEVITDIPYNSMDPDVVEGNPLFIEIGERAAGNFGYDYLLLEDAA